MKKSLLALAVVAAMPAVALAQSSVTVSGNLKLGVASNSFSGGASGSGSGIMEGSSRFVLSGVEDLGSGLKAVFQMDQRFKPDDAGTLPGSPGTAAGATATKLTADNGNFGNGNTFVGLAGGFGQVIAGRLDLHYGAGVDEHGIRATALQHSSISVLSYVNAQSTSAGTGGAHSIANGTRTTNVVQYTAPAMGAFSVSAAYTFTPVTTPEIQLGSDRGGGYNLVAAYAAGPLSAGVSLWDAKSSGVTTVSGNTKQKSTRPYALYDLGVAKIGLTYDVSSIAIGSGSAAPEWKRSAFSIPVTAPLGKGTVLFTYTKASDSKKDGVSQAGTGATHTVVGYDYPLSKRTTVGASYSLLNNGASGNYQMFTGTALGNVTSVATGTDYKSLYVGVRHAF